jgi:hypothetical protein
MKSASISDIKTELKELEPSRLKELCLQLAKYKKDNKEYLAFLLFESHDKNLFTTELKKEITDQFNAIDKTNNLYFVKKSLRKILRSIVKYCKYIDDKALAAELYIYFCDCLNESGIPYERSQLLVNMYAQQLKKINTLVAALHPDLQADYNNDLVRITIA